MKLRNSTDYSDHCLRRMVSWCCRQVDLAPSEVRSAQFTKASGRGRGRAWSSMRILVRVGEGPWPWTHQYRKTAPSITYNDAAEFLVSLTAHELWHLKQYLHRWKTNEAQNERVSLDALTAFRADRESLWAEWSRQLAMRESAPKSSATDRRAEKAITDLERWMRKLKLATTKVRKLRKRVRYYEQKMAARSGSSKE